MSDLFDDSPDFSTNSYVWQHLPWGYELVATPSEMRLYGAFVSHLAEVLHTVGGHWDPDLLAYILPHGRPVQIDLALKKFQQQQSDFDQTMAILAAHSGPEAAPKEDQRRRRAIDNRLKVVVGQYQAGDRLKGQTILEFGKTWQEFPGLEWYFHHKDKCLQCHRYRGVSGTRVCQPCSAQQQDIKPVAYCYAYFD
ncbi:MAG: hypothetical protein QGG88_06775 [Gammaproteobacteria bacterium]|jgi:hypothetical protein|nr:hypothetical protein [Gammaproteobacteria bacterium]